MKDTTRLHTHVSRRDCCFCTVGVNANTVERASVLVCYEGSFALKGNGLGNSQESADHPLRTAVQQNLRKG